MNCELTLRFPPSVNARYIHCRNSRRLILSNETRSWLEYASWTIKAYTMNHNLQPIKVYTYFDLYWYPPSGRSDCHNSEKVLFDAFEQGGLVSNDVYIKNRTQEVSKDANNPRVIVKWIHKGEK